MARPKKVNSEPAQEKAAPAAETGKQFSEAEVQAMIQKAVSDALAQAAQANPVQVVQVSPNAEMVHFLWQAEVSDENVYEVGPNAMYARIVGKTGSFAVPKNELSRAMDTMFRLMLEKRWIIAVDGLTDAERESFGVNYHDGELLDKKAFAKMVDLREQILDIYPKLCAGHREMVAKRYHEAYNNGSPNVTREIVKELNRMSKEMGSKNGDFTDIIEAMNEADKD